MMMSMMMIAVVKNGSSLWAKKKVRIWIIRRRRHLWRQRKWSWLGWCEDDDNIDDTNEEAIDQNDDGDDDLIVGAGEGERGRSRLGSAEGSAELRMISKCKFACQRRSYPWLFGYNIDDNDISRCIFRHTRVSSTYPSKMSVRP